MGAERLLVGDGEVRERPVGAEARLGQTAHATAIDAVRLSMSTAPRPHTHPSISSPPNGSWPPPVGHRNDVGVAQEQSEGASARRPSMRATRLRRPGGGS